MKREAPDHIKVRRLARALGIRRCYAVGILEMLWHVTSRLAPRGDIGRVMTDVEIAEELDHAEDEAARLIGALVSCGWLDQHPEYRLVVHDWSDHCDDTVRRRLSRQGLAPIARRGGDPLAGANGVGPGPACATDHHAAQVIEGLLVARGLSATQARWHARQIGQDDAAVVVAYYDALLASGQLARPLAALRDMLLRPEAKWHFRRDQRGRLIAPVETAMTVDDLAADIEARRMAAKE